MNQPNLQRIMYVEDEPDLREIVGLSLREIGNFDLLVCSSGSEALERAPEFQPQMILLDVMMPGMDGPETLQALRQLSECAETPVAFITAKVNTAETERLMALGAAGIIGKPFDPMTLHATVSDVWGRAMAKSEETTGDADISSEIVALTHRFRDRMQTSMEKLHVFREALTENGATPSPETLKELHSLAHRLNGSGATFGFAHVSESAAALEILIQDCRDSGDISAEGVIRHLDGLLTQLECAIAQGQSADAIRSEIPSVSSHPNP